MRRIITPCHSKFDHSWTSRVSKSHSKFEWELIKLALFSHLARYHLVMQLIIWMVIFIDANCSISKLKIWLINDMIHHKHLLKSHNYTEMFYCNDQCKSIANAIINLINILISRFTKHVFLFAVCIDDGPLLLFSKLRFGFDVWINCFTTKFYVVGLAARCKWTSCWLAERNWNQIINEKWIMVLHNY